MIIQVLEFVRVRFVIVVLLGISVACHADESYLYQPPHVVPSGGVVSVPYRFSSRVVPVVGPSLMGNAVYYSRPVEKYVYVSGCSSCKAKISTVRSNVTPPRGFAGFAFVTNQRPAAIRRTPSLIKTTPVIHASDVTEVVTGILPSVEGGSGIGQSFNTPVISVTSESGASTLVAPSPVPAEPDPIESVVEDKQEPSETKASNAPGRIVVPQKEPVLPKAVEGVASVEKPEVVDAQGIPEAVETTEFDAKLVAEKTLVPAKETESTESPDAKTVEPTNSEMPSVPDVKIAEEAQDQSEPEPAEPEDGKEVNEDVSNGKKTAVKKTPADLAADEDSKDRKQLSDAKPERKVVERPVEKTTPRKSSKKPHEPSAKSKSAHRVPSLSPLLSWNLSEFNVAKGMTDARSSGIVSKGSIRIERNNTLDLSKGWVNFPSAEKTVLDQIVKAKKFSVVVSLMCENSKQDGPARIVSNSKDTDERNFTVGQDGKRFVVRVRTSKKDENGSRYETKFGQVKPGKRQSVAVTYDGRRLTCFVDGKEVAERKFTVDFKSWRQFPVSVGNEATGDRDWSGRIYSLLVLPTADTVQVKRLLKRSED